MKDSELRHEQVFRPPYSRLLAITWFVIALIFAVDAAVNGSGDGRWLALAVLLFASAAVHALAFRPAVLVDDTGITLRNIVRDVHVPWGNVARIGARWSLTIDTLAPDRTWASWAITARNRQRMALFHRGFTAGAWMGGRGAQASAYAGAADETPDEEPYVSVELSRAWDAASARGALAPGSVEVRWVWPVIVASAVSGVLLVAAVAAALARS
jgi:hypothetical protein